jgi:hypothetical protein
MNLQTDCQAHGHVSCNHSLGGRPGQRNLPRTPAWRVSRGMGDRACGAAGLPPRRFVSAVRRAKVPPCLRRSGFAQAGTGFLRSPHWPVRPPFHQPWLKGYCLPSRFIFQLALTCLSLKSRPPASLKKGRSIFFKLPIRHLAPRTGPSVPFISEPSGRPAILGIPYPECLVAVGNDFCLKSDDRNRFDSVQQAGTGWPEFHLLE